MGSSRRDRFIDMAVDRFIFKNNQITLFPCFNFILKSGVWDYLKQVLVFTVIDRCNPMITLFHTF